MKKIIWYVLVFSVVLHYGYNLAELISCQFQEVMPFIRVVSEFVLLTYLVYNKDELTGE